MIYLDYAASGVPFPECIERMGHIALEHYANPGGLHDPAGEARGLLHRCRRTMAGLLGVPDRSVFFTSGGTEANNWAVQLGCRPGEGKTILVGATEHKSVLQPALAMKQLGYRVELLYPDKTGRIPPETVRTAITADTALLCIQAVNNETGTQQDIGEISRIARSCHVPFLCDAVQSFGHLALPLNCADYVTLSAHKFGGPRGVGCLIARQNCLPQPLIHGGGQELGLRSGTENLPGIAAMTLAAELSCAALGEEQKRLSALTALLFTGLREAEPGLTVNGDPSRGHPGILNCRFPGISGEELTAKLDRKGICVSPGAVCGARDSKPSHVLLAMGCSEVHARESVRFSPGRNTTEEEILQTVAAVKEILIQKRKER